MHCICHVTVCCKYICYPFNAVFILLEETFITSEFYVGHSTVNKSKYQINLYL